MSLALEIKLPNGTRAEVTRTISGNYAVMYFPLGGEPLRAACNFIDRDEAAKDAMAWVLLQDEWEPAKVGCYWSKGDYHIATYRCGSESGYALTHEFTLVGRYPTLDEAKGAADGHLR